MVKSTERVCHYETLGLEPNCSEKEIKAAHRKLILTYHWDKCRSSQCGLSQEEATAKFLEVQQAYEILMDPIKRETYNAYRQTYAVPEVFNPDLDVPFDSIVFNGYSSSSRSFYNAYSDIFQRIYANERAFQKKNDLPWNSVHKPPDMGNLDTPYPEVVQFYNYWLNFSSIMDFCWEDPHDEYDLSQISRKGVKEWSRINMKARKKAKKEYNNKVRCLTQTAKRLDRRVVQMVAKREEERKREIEEERERRKRLKKEKLVKAMEYEEQEWTKPVERKRKYSNKEEEEEEEKGRDEWECVVCRKVFRSERQCRNHEQSKKHLRMVAELMELLEVSEEKPDEEEVLEEGKRNEVVGGSDSEAEFVDGVNDNQREKLSETGEVDDEEVEEDEIGVLEAMVARRKTMEEVGEDILESILVEPMASSSQEVKNADEVAMEHDKLKNTNQNEGERKPRRRRAKSNRTDERDGSNMKESKPDCSAEKGYDEDQIKKRKGGQRKERSGKKSNGKGDIEHKKMRSGGRSEEKKGKKRNGGERRINEHGTSYFSAVNESYLNMLHLIFI